MRCGVSHCLLKHVRRQAFDIITGDQALHCDSKQQETLCILCCGLNLNSDRSFCRSNSATAWSIFMHTHRERERERQREREREREKERESPDIISRCSRMQGCEI